MVTPAVAPGASPGSTFHPLSKVAIPSVDVPANSTATVAPLGQGGIPKTGVSHAYLMVYAGGSNAGKLTMYPSGTAKPNDTILDYGGGVRQINYVVAALGSDGKVTLHNAGSGAVTVYLDVVGYFASPTAPVAGSTVQPLNPARVVSGEVLDGVGATRALDLRGLGGIPATDVSGIAINITTYVEGSGTGALSVYPSGAPVSTRYAVPYDADQYDSNSFPVSLGSDGKFVIRNGFAVKVKFWVDVFGYFKRPSGCASNATGPVSRKAAQAVDIPVESFSRTDAMQATANPGDPVGALEYAYTDNIGRLLHGHQSDPASFNSTQWTVISEGEAFTGEPDLAEQGDGRLQVVGHNTTGNVWTRTQATKVPAAWGSWADSGAAMASHAAVIRQDDTLVAFAVDSAGRLQVLPQYDPNAAYGSWIDVGLTGLASTTPVAVPVRDGIQVFVLDTSGVWRTALYRRGLLSECMSVTDAGETGAPAVVVYPGSKLRIFVRASDGRILTKMQDDAGAWPSAWQQVGTFIAAGAPSAVLSPGTGRVEVVARNAAGEVYSTGETTQGSGQWRDWVLAKDPDDTTLTATDPKAFEYTGSAGPVWAYIVRTSTNQVRFYEAREAPAPAGSEAGEKAPPKFVRHDLPAPPPVG